MKPDDVFGVAPEIGRLLAVLIPIENAIFRHYKCDEKSQFAWDQPFFKWEFESLWREYHWWFERKGKQIIKPTITTASAYNEGPQSHRIWDWDFRWSPHVRLFGATYRGYWRPGKLTFQKRDPKKPEE